ncbi:PucR family transcriptional regulator [Allofournierella sp.]|uniref:PucR family transcriptional regulator n=1 Tax=Allofournierella sp. TaxID=1940256 RepID=UPI003AB24FF4
MGCDLDAKELTRFIGALRAAFSERRVKGLLAEYAGQLGCRAVAVLGQDVYACPPLDHSWTGSISEGCHKLPGGSELEGLCRYFDTGRQEYLLWGRVNRGGVTVGELILSRGGQDFSTWEEILVEYGCALCAGLEQEGLRSAGAHRLLCSAYEGREPAEESLPRLPERGRAVVLRLEAGRGPAEGSRFLGYLIHREFGSRLCFAFAQPDGPLLAFAGEPGGEAVPGELAALLEQNGRGCTVGVSEVYPRGELCAALEEARHAASIGALLADGKKVYHYGSLGIYRLFSYPDNGWPINRMLAAMTRELNRFHPEKRAVLADTIAAFVENNFSYTKTGDQLYTHPNTIRYRVQILEKLWRYDLTNEEDKLLFRVLGKLLPLWMRYMEQLGVDIYADAPGQEPAGKIDGDKKYPVGG